MIEKKTNRLESVRYPLLCQLTSRLESFPTRFQRHVEIQPNTDCWQWTGSKSGVPGFPQHAYGRYAQTTCPVYVRIAHRFAYEFVHGKIPAGLEIDHLCGNKLCVNPQHLELVTHQENCKRRFKSGPERTPGSIRDRRFTRQFSRLLTGGAE
jgi:hypothetical protein